MNYITRSTQSVLGYTTYEVIEQVSNSTFNKFVVIYDVISCEIKCQCLLFDSRGILCRHSLSVLSFERVDKVALKYILEHGSKNNLSSLLEFCIGLLIMSWLRCKNIKRKEK
ncbi:hypothetical protein Ahy_B06g081424 isoform B [Arachis hypogaea]|uniref:SWIM-type domain-containing protein n=1 Tax=Arachis hypogaea TaxID=3818 RepID=A0A444YKY4_ARAHY|nr:hypothetical protein Ahy_B06g081424 isoform B [Arachis hypogaea]